MNIDGWKYYNRAAIPATLPTQETNLAPLQDGSIWKIGEGGALFARWSTNFDCSEKTSWWYVVKDDPFDINLLKSKRRYEINKGNKNFEVKLIAPQEYKEDILNVQVAAFSAYPEKYRPKVDVQKFKKEIDEWPRTYRVFAAFSRENDELCGYALLREHESKWVEFNVLKTNPKSEPLAVNAAIVYAIMEYYNEILQKGGIICDGERSVSHETKFQDYLEKYFCFRKAYCKLNIKYRSRIKLLVKIAYPFRALLKQLDGIGFIHQVNAVLKMESIIRESK